MRPQAPPPVVRVGVDHSPPFYAISPDGSVTGLAVDVFNEAARRKNIRLEWVPTQDVPIDDLLSKHRVDVWPLVGITQERQKKFYFTEPWAGERLRPALARWTPHPHRW